MEMKFDLLNHPHSHPLFFIEEGKNNDGESVLCSKCSNPLNPPAFSCSDSDCNFHIHQSCINLSSQIQNHFHPQHPLFLTTNNYFCNACWQMPSGKVYQCGVCGFQIDIKCAIADTKAIGVRPTTRNEFRHFNHPHPLTFHPHPQHKRSGTNEMVCVVCELLVKSASSYYSCTQCDAHFHQQCAELPREVLYSDFHEHALFLLPDISFTKTVCNSCKNDCREFVYNCAPCKFNIHVACLQSFNHKHTFTKFRNQTEFVCRACGEKGNGFSWFCTICHLSVHKKCAELPLTLRTFEHRLHDLRLTYFRDGVDIVRNKNVDCKICSEEIRTKFAGYGCYQCNYFIHLHCAPNAATMDDFDSTDDEEDNEEIKFFGTQIQHFIHHHNLILFSPEEVGKLDKVCDGCMKGLSEISPSYGCNYKECDFIAHKECLEFPRKKRNFVHQHKLTLISIPNFVFQCKACRQHFNGFAYHCESCLSTFDIRCASIKVPFQHPSHQHPLSLDRTNEDHKCEACGKGVKNKVAFRCVRCNFHLDAGCATLPIAVKYRIDAHPLSLAFVDEEEGGDECYCDICELKREPLLWFYSCRECKFDAHVDCVVGEFPFVKSKMHEAHRHPLNLAMKKKEFDDDCRACSESCADDLGFECRVCSFNVHAVGQCYLREVAQRNLAFTNRCFYPRGIGLHEYSIPKGWTRVQLGPYGGRGGNPWEQKVFSTIRAFAIFHDKWVHSFQIHYENDGELIWSENHGGSGGSRSEIVFDYPDEFLVSIRGYYSDLRNWGSEIIVIRSLTLETNKRSWGSYGEEDGTEFSFPVGMKFIGLHGRFGSFLDAIGPHAISKE